MKFRDINIILFVLVVVLRNSLLCLPVLVCLVGGPALKLVKAAVDLDNREGWL